MLHISLKELVRGVQQDLRPYHLWLDRQKSQGILKLIPEPKRATALVEGGATPDSARYRLIHQPTVHHKVE
jgi:hypothetical protein